MVCEICKQTLWLYASNDSVRAVYPVVEGTTMLKDVEYVHTQCWEDIKDEGQDG